MKHQSTQHHQDPDTSSPNPNHDTNNSRNLATNPDTNQDTSQGMNQAMKKGIMNQLTNLKQNQNMYNRNIHSTKNQTTSLSQDKTGHQLPVKIMYKIMNNNIIPNNSVKIKI